MAELETITQQFNVNTAQAAAALEQMQRELRETGTISEKTTSQMTRGLTALGAGVSRRSSEVARGTALMRTGFQQLGFQIQDVIVSLQAGQRPMTVLAQQGSQIASIFGPAGAAVGIFLAAAGGLGSVLFGMGRGAEEADTALKDLVDTLKQLGQQDDQAKRIVDQLSELRDEAQRLGQIQIDFTVEDLEPQLDAAREKLRAFLQEMITAVEAPAAQISMQRGVPLQGLIERAPEIIAPFTPQDLQRLHDLQQGMEAGSVSGADLAEELSRINIVMGGLFQEDDRRRAADLAIEIEKLAGNLEAAAAGAAHFEFRGAEGGAGKSTGGLRSEPFTGQRPIQPVDLLASVAGPLERENELLREGGRTREQIQAQMRVERERGRELEAGERARLDAIVATNQALQPRSATLKAEVATLQSILAPIERESELLAEGLLTREEIAALLRAEQQLKRGLTDAEQQLLNVAIGTNEALKERQQEIERQEKLIKTTTENLQEQLEAAELLNEFAGIETAEYQRQLGLLKLKHAGVEEITEEQKRLNDELVKERTLAEQQAAAREQRLERGQLGRERESLGENLFAQQFTGLPAEEFRVQEELARLRDAGTQVTPDLEQSIRQTERMRTELGFMETAATAAGDAMTDLVTESLFGDGPEEAARRFTQALAEMALQAALTQVAIVALKAAMGGGAGTTMAPATGAQFGAGNTTGAGGAGFSYTSFGGPRQHGGPVRAGSTYLVGERGAELFTPRSSGSIIPHGGVGAQAPVVNVYNESGAKVDVNTDVQGVIDLRIRSGVAGMLSDGSLHRGLGVKRQGIARG